MQYEDLSRAQQKHLQALLDDENHRIPNNTFRVLKRLNLVSWGLDNGKFFDYLTPDGEALLHDYIHRHYNGIRVFPLAC